MQRLLVYDATQRRQPPLGLGLAWQYGSVLYRGLRRIHGAHPGHSWQGALRWAVTQAQTGPISELQFWGHGKWGCALIGRERLDRSALGLAHPLRRELEALRANLTPNALIWFRTCETLGARAGHDFAAALADFLGARVAGHTFVIGFYQSGLHELPPGCRPDWSEREGLSAGTPERPERAFDSGPSRPNTITCLNGRVPSAWATQHVLAR